MASRLVALMVLVAAAAGDQRILLDQDYNLQERPASPEEGKPLLIQVVQYRNSLRKGFSKVSLIQASINLRNILEVREKEQLVSLEITLRLYWKVRRR